MKADDAFTEFRPYMLKKNVLGIDRGKNRLGFAYQEVTTGIITPIGYLSNDESLLFHLGDMLQRYSIAQVVIGYPKKHESFQKKIDELCSQIELLDESIPIHKADEEYSSVQAGAKVEQFSKTPQEDPLAAMIIIENWLNESS